MTLATRIRSWFRQRTEATRIDSLETAPPALPAPPAPQAPSAAWVARRLASGATYVEVSPAAVATLRERWPDKASRVVEQAGVFLRHEFDLLGSGPFVPDDPDRPRRGDYAPIDWYLDPVRRLRFPRGIHHKDWKLYEMRPQNADIKYPWELARCQHWATLGQAYRLTDDDRFAREIANELDDFVDANPVGIGVNWTCTMDVGLRAVSWAIGLELVRQSPALDQAFWQRAYAALFDHGVFIRGHLENTYEVTSNHFLSNVVGLWFLGAVFADLPEGRAWASFARGSLEQEMTVQVLPDGADFESAVPYHRLVTELFLGSARLGDVAGQPLSPQYRTRVRDMVEYLVGVLRPDGLMPQAGDADDGRLHVLTGCGLTTPQDPRHILGPAAMMFEQLEWLAVCGEDAGWEAAWWGFEVPSVARASVPRVVRLFPEAGHAVVRSDGHYLLITNSIVGTKGFGNHKHNDQLSFEYHVGGHAIVVDPGSFVYTSDADARNLFRGTAYHNTLQIDGSGAERDESRVALPALRERSRGASRFRRARGCGGVSGPPRRVSPTRIAGRPRTAVPLRRRNRRSGGDGSAHRQWRPCADVALSLCTGGRGRPGGLAQLPAARRRRERAAGVARWSRRPNR